MKHQREIMAAHWSYEMVSLSTAVVYFRDAQGNLQHISYAVVSDEMCHDKASVYSFNSAILENIKLVTNVNKLHYWSDGAASQFKNRFNLSSIIYHQEDFGNEATWNFFETAHGKGLCHGIGAEVKRAVWHSILQSREVVTSAKGFFETAQSLCKKINVLYIPKQKVRDVTEKLHERWRKCKTIPNTHCVHYVAKSSDSSITMAKNSQFFKTDACQIHNLISKSSADSGPTISTTSTHSTAPPTSTAQTPSTAPATSTTSTPSTGPPASTASTPSAGPPASSTPTSSTGPTASIASTPSTGPPVSTTSIPSTGPPPSTASTPSTGPTTASITLGYGLPPELSATFSSRSTFTLPANEAAIIAAILDGRVKFQGKGIITGSDLNSLQGGHVREEDNYLTNFVIDTYLEILQAARPGGLEVAVFPWEAFGKSAVKLLLTGKGKLLEQDIILAPCNPPGSMHWFLIAVFPGAKLMAALDSKAGAFVKPTAEVALLKMWNTLQKADNSLDASQWQFVANKPSDLPRQTNSWDCGVFGYLYARFLVTKGVMLCDQHGIPDFRKHMIMELVDPMTALSSHSSSSTEFNQQLPRSLSGPGVMMLTVYIAHVCFMAL